MSFSTLIVRPSGIAPARGGVLETVSRTIQSATPPQRQLTKDQQAYEDWLASQGGPSAISTSSRRSGRLDEIQSDSEAGPTYFSNPNTPEHLGAGMYDDAPGDEFFEARIMRDGTVDYGSYNLPTVSGTPEVVITDVTGDDAVIAKRLAKTRIVCRHIRECRGRGQCIALKQRHQHIHPGNTVGGLPADFAKPVETLHSPPTSRPIRSTLSRHSPRSRTTQPLTTRPQLTPVRSANPSVKPPSVPHLAQPPLLAR